MHEGVSKWHTLFHPLPSRQYMYALTILFNLLLMESRDDKSLVQMISFHRLCQSSNFAFARAVKVKSMAHLYGFRNPKAVAHHKVTFGIFGLVVEDFFCVPPQFNVDQVFQQPPFLAGEMKAQPRNDAVIYGIDFLGVTQLGLDGIIQLGDWEEQISVFRKFQVILGGGRVLHPYYLGK